MNSANVNTSPSSLWEEEYAKQGIPSSVRSEPSGSVVDFIAFIGAAPVAGAFAIDVGCGGGRNSLYLASLGYNVISMDFAASQIEKLKSSAKDGGLEKKISPHCHDIRERWPVIDASADVLIDAFCFKHQIEANALQFYASEARRVAKLGGHVLLSFAGRRDGYYSAFPVDDEPGPGVVIVDPANQIASRLYHVAEVRELFKGFEIVAQHTKRNRNEMHGKLYDRETHAIYLRRVRE